MKITLKAARANKGLTQQEAADRIGVSRWTYMFMESHPERATVENAKKACDVFGVGMDDIIFLPTDQPEVGS